MPSEPDQYLGPAGRFIEILVGLIVLGASGLLGYFGGLGAWMYLHGSSAAPASPFACAIGLGAGFWGGYAGLRMLFGWRKERALVPSALLLIGGIAAFLGGVLLLILDLFSPVAIPRALPMGSMLTTVGIAAIGLWWRRREAVPG